MHVHIRLIDTLTVVAYLSAILGVGLWSARRSTKSDHYFAGHRNFPGWIVALSLLGSIISSTTFLALPAAAYVLDWRQLNINLAMPFVAVLAAVVFIPFFRRAGLTSTFEYLGERFGALPRFYCTLNYLVLQSIRLALVLYLVALPVQLLTGASLEMVIVGCGTFVALYSLAGGMETLVWANAIQAVMKVCGGVLCLTCLLVQLPGGWSQVLAVGHAHGKFGLGSFQWNLQERTFWTVAILGIMNWLHLYSGEQTVVQRYISARTTREARKATLLFAVLAVPVWVMFFLIGTALFVFFLSSPDPAVSHLQPEQVLPYYVLRHVPAGLAGCVIAAILAAAMSALDSGVNSFATVIVVDLLRPYGAQHRPDHFYLRSARIATAGALGCAVGGALLLHHIPKESVNDLSLIVLSVFGGCTMGLYMLGFFTERVDATAVKLALAVTLPLNAVLGCSYLGFWPRGWTIPVHSYWVGPIVNLVFMALAYGFSLWPRGSRRSYGPSVWTRSSVPIPASHELASSPPRTIINDLR